MKFKINMKLFYKLIVFFVLSHGFSFKTIDNVDVYLYVNSANNETAKITFGRTINNTKLREYTLEYQSHHSFGNISSQCIYDDNFIKLNKNNFEKLNHSELTLSIKKRSKIKNQVEIQISKKVLPCWIKLDKSFLRVKSSNKIKVIPQNDTLEITIISDIDKLEDFYHFKINKGSKVFIHQFNKLSTTGSRGDLRPEIAKIKYGYQRNDTIEFYGKNDLIYKFIKQK